MSMQEPNDEAGSSIAETLGDLVGDLSLPTPIRKNALKAFGQLCTAAIDIPVAHLEGIAAEKRAETRARVKIISTGADQIATQMNVDPEFARVAVKKYGQKIVREQVNLDRITEVAAIELQNCTGSAPSDQADTVEEPSISEDWLNTFEQEASQKSTEEMRILFGKILAGEIKKPSSFSIKTLKLIGQLDNEAATLFRILCSLCVALKIGNHIYDARVLSPGGSPGSNSLKAYGLSYAKFNILLEYRLIIPEYETRIPYAGSILNEHNLVKLPIFHGGRYWAFESAPGRPIEDDLRLSGVAFSISGRELLPIVDITPDETYTTALQEFVKTKQVSMVEYTRREAWMS